VRAAVEQGVIELIYEGERNGLWKFGQETTSETTDKQTNITDTEVSEEG